jgi:hypothetical protein
VCRFERRKRVTPIVIRRKERDECRGFQRWRRRGITMEEEGDAAQVFGLRCAGLKDARG